jgi:hypothetical protein
MKNTLLTVSLLSAAAAASAQSASPAMSYDFVRVGFAQEKFLDGLTVSGSALLGDHIIVGGEYRDLNGRGFNGGGEGTAFNLGARFGVGYGDIIISASYGQLQGSAVDEDGDIGVLAGNQTTLSVTYRHSFNETWEAFIGVSNIRTEAAAGSFNFDTEEFALGAGSSSDNAVSIAVRCNLSKEFDITASNAWVDGDATWSLSVGYNF